MKTQIEAKYMMATTAIHQTGDISRDTPDICIVSEEDDNNYIGNWVCGFGFIDVKFPKSTTRDLTPDEVEKYHGTVTMLGSGFGPTINIKGEDFLKDVLIIKKEDGSVHNGTLIAPLKVGGIIAMIISGKGTAFHSSKIQSINGNEVKTRNSTYDIQYLVSAGEPSPFNS